MLDPSALTPASARIRVELEEARRAGAWMPWAGLLLALTLWGGTGMWLASAIGLESLLSLPAPVLAGGVGALLAPGLALICAGVMARESVRSAQANVIVLSSARLLLEPAEASRAEILSLGEAIALQTQTLERSLSETRARLDGLRREFDVSVTSALKAAEIVRADSDVLVGKLGAERDSLQSLSDGLRQQSDDLAKAIPRHAQLIAEAARTAQEQVRKSDATLEHRLRELHDAAGQLAQRIGQIDTMSAESRKRAQNLTSILMRLDEQLVQSTRMVEAATHAGEIAAAATRSTAQSLRDAMSDAISSALQASETITTRSAHASEEARQSLALIKETAIQADATTRASAHAARLHAEETGQRIRDLSEAVLQLTNRAAHAADNGLERARADIERASALLGRMRLESDTSSVDDLLLEPAPPDLYDRSARDRVAGDQPTIRPFPLLTGMPAGPATYHEPADGRVALQNVRASAHMAGAGAQAPGGMTDQARGLAPQAARTQASDEARAQEDSWRTLLSTIAPSTPRPAVAATADAMIERLDRAGLRLQAMKAADLRRIASASNRGDRHRRQVTHRIAPSEIRRVSDMLAADRELQLAAREFVSREAPHALRALSGGGRTREAAAHELSAYLLLDTALGMQL